jgi:hypothetical protein
VVIDTSALGASIGAGSQFNLAVSGNNLVLTFVPVPEPTGLLAVGAVVFGLAVRTGSGRSRSVTAHPGNPSSHQLRELGPLGGTSESPVHH